jgi:uncharacterized protein
MTNPFAILLFSVAVASSANATEAEIDCSGNLSRIEKLVCDSPGVMALDKVLATEYKKAIARTSPGTEVKQSQKEWLSSTRVNCMDTTCLIRVYDDRISVLQSVQGRPATAAVTRATTRPFAGEIPAIEVPKAPPKQSHVVVSSAAPTAGLEPLGESQSATAAAIAPPARRSNPPVRSAYASSAIQPSGSVAGSHLVAARNERSTPNGTLAAIATILILIAQAITPRRDRRFKTGYKENKTVPSAVYWLYLTSAVAGVCAFVV